GALPPNSIVLDDNGLKIRVPPDPLITPENNKSVEAVLSVALNVWVADPRSKLPLIVAIAVVPIEVTFPVPVREMSPKITVLSLNLRALPLLVKVRRP